MSEGCICLAQNDCVLCVSHLLSRSVGKPSDQLQSLFSLHTMDLIRKDSRTSPPSTTHGTSVKKGVAIIRGVQMALAWKKLGLHQPEDGGGLDEMERRVSCWNTLSLESAFSIHKPGELNESSSSKRRRPNTCQVKCFSIMDLGADVWGQIAIESSQLYFDDPTGVKRSPFAGTTIEKLPDKVLLNIFSYLSHREICCIARICKKWRMIAYDTRLWKNVSLRPEISGLHVGSLESLLALISIRFGPSLHYIELPIELITHTVLHELANKCPNLTHMLLDFSTAMQLHDFSEMQAFPTKLRYLCICLSEVIFMEGFMRKIYNFINGLEILHLIGTYEKVEEEEEEIYEVINVHKLKSATPNLRVINLYGINFIDDSHIDAFSSNCIQLECLAVNYCNKVTGSTMKTLFQRSRRLRCLLMNQTNLKSEYVMQVEWEKSSIQELDITATDLSTECLIDMLTRIPSLRFLSAGQINGFNDSVLKAFVELGNTKNLISLDLDSSDNLTDDGLHRFLSRLGHQLWGLSLSGMSHITDQLWQSVLPILNNAKIIIMGTSERLGVNIHVDQLMDGIANNCPNLERIELKWDPENLRFSDKSQKAIDILRVKCLKLRCLTLSDGRYYEIVKANFERADRTTVVRTTTSCRVSTYYLLSNYKDLIFN